MNRNLLTAAKTRILRWLASLLCPKSKTKTKIKKEEMPFLVENLFCCHNKGVETVNSYLR